MFKLFTFWRRNESIVADDDGSRPLTATLAFFEFGLVTLVNCWSLLKYNLLEKFYSAILVMHVTSVDDGRSESEKHWKYRKFNLRLFSSL